jgi:methylmalonyl-CoA mutase
MVPVALDAGPHSAETAMLLLELWRRGSYQPHELRGSLRIDPIGASALAGVEDPSQIDALSVAAVGMVGQIRDEFPDVRVLAVDTAPYVDAGLGTTLEIALALAAGIGYLRAGERVGIGAHTLAASLEFTLTVGPDQFLEIAKLRAFRRLWAAALKHCGVAPQQRRSAVYTVTSRRMASSLDPWVNLLRATTAAFAAGVGGADGVTVLAFDEPIVGTAGSPGSLGRRVARNTQLVLMEEASLHRVADPAGGAWYVESLTNELATCAWSEMREIERAGGVASAIASGTISARASEAMRERHELLSRRRRLMTGVNAFPLLGDDGFERAPATDSGRPAQPLAPVRDAAQFEALRARAEILTSSAGRRPTVLLACVGSVSDHLAVQLWAKSFFEAGGIEAVSQLEDHILLGEATDAAVCAGTGADPVPAVAKLRTAGAKNIYLVGATETEATAAGADIGVRDGVDMVAVLGALLDRAERLHT